MAWRVDGETDLVLNLHLQPSGKPEVIRPVVGLYFTDTPPSRHPMLVQLEHDGAIDIPPGSRDFAVTDHYRLPVDVDVLGVYPHAHYLGKQVEAFATLPDGTKKWLIRIRDWDFNWQAVYRYREPVPLPRGSTVHMRIGYDNTTDNPRNPSDPPRRVRAGNRSSDEMGHLWLQLLPRQRDERWLLQEAAMQRRLEKYPGDFVAHANLGAVLEARGRRRKRRSSTGKRCACGRTARRCSTTWARCSSPRATREESLRLYREAVRAQPDYASARYNLGNALAASGAYEGALAQFREVVRLRPGDTGAQAQPGRRPARHRPRRRGDRRAAPGRGRRPAIAERRSSTWAAPWPRAGTSRRRPNTSSSAVSLDPADAAGPAEPDRDARPPAPGALKRKAGGTRPLPCR